jgi:hypothetical protein
MSYKDRHFKKGENIMTWKDLITVFMLILGLFWGTGMLILLKRNKSKLETWPHIFGVGTGVYMFVASMTASIFLRPISEFVDYTIENLFWTLALGIMGYFSGRKIARDSRK